MNRVWFIRHGHHDWIGKVLVGRKPGIGLNEAGHRQAQSIAERLRGENFAAIYSSPQQRALETAEPLARANGLAIRTMKELDEIDFGGWTGRSFGELETDPLWAAWNNARGKARARDGES